MMSTMRPALSLIWLIIRTTSETTLPRASHLGCRADQLVDRACLLGVAFHVEVSSSIDPDACCSDAAWVSVREDKFALALTISPAAD